jgi:RNA polymerase sigma-70 factor, ECF subfamily
MNQQTPPTAMTELSDASLLLEYQAGETHAATTLYERYASELHKLVERRTAASLSPRVDAEDIVQSVFRTFFRRVAANQYSAPPGEDLWKLFLVMALNKIRSVAAHHNAAKRDVRQTLQVGDYAEVLHARHEEHCEGTILRMVIDEAVAKLPESAGQIIRLRIEGEEVNEIGRKANRSKRSVERVLQNFREQLKRQLDDNG